MWYPIGNHINTSTETGGVDVRAYYFFMKFLRSFAVAFCTAVVLFAFAAVVGIVIYLHCV